MSVNSGHPKLRIVDLQKKYGEFVALEGASLDVADGEFLTLLGPSGSGKTTLLLAVAGLNEPDGGAVWIDDRLATYLPPFKRDLGMVFQNYALFPHMTVFDNLAFPLKMRRWPQDRIRTAVERVLETVRLPHVAQRYPRQLSGGQQQRIALARAMVYEPSVILMDEPLGALDRKLREQMQLEIKRLHHELGIAVVYVTHDQEEALVMSDRICLMHQGRIAQIGTPDELYFRPQMVFAADFLGEANLLSGRVADTDGSAVGVELPGGQCIRGVSDHCLSHGESVRVMVRPETIRLLSDGETAANVLEAKSVDVVMSGGTTRIFFRTCAGLEIFARTLTGSSTAQAGRDTEVRIGWDVERAIVLPDT